MMGGSQAQRSAQVEFGRNAGTVPDSGIAKAATMATWVRARISSTWANAPLMLHR
jgi:hypothetical protein